MTCKICNNRNCSVVFQLENTYEIIKCNSCTVQFLHPQLNDKELEKLYSENYYKSWGIKGEEENDITKQMKIATFDLRLNLITQFVTKGKILDVGCATGYFLEAAKKRNFTPYGIDFSEYSSSIAKKKFGVNNVFTGILETCNFESQQFDVIAMSDLIEHVRVPQKTISKASELLKDDGIIMIMTPNTDSFLNKLMAKRWTHYKLEHFFYFNRQSIEIVANQAGLKVVYYEKSKKALTLNYLHTQFNVYNHWLFTPAINFLCFLLPQKIINKNFYIGIGEMVVLLKKNSTNGRISFF